MPRAIAQPQSPTFTSGSPPPGAWHVPYTFTLTASGNPAPIFLAIPSQMFLPPGLVLNGTTGVLSGTPTQAGTFGFQVQASNGVGTAPYQSLSVFFAPNQTITFDPLPGRIVGSPPFRLSATASSGLTVGFFSSTPSVCTASFGMATLVAAGTCTINAIQSGNASYSNALPVARSFSVTAAGTQSQTITFAALANRAYGSGAFSVSASATSGLAVTFSSLTASVCSVNASSVALLSQGTCTIRASQPGDATFAAAPNVDRSFVVTAPLSNQSITFATLSNKSLGSPSFAIGATASSGLPVAFSSLTVAVCTVAGSTVTLVTAGACTIRASQPGNAVYAPAPDVDRTFTVAAATAQTISFSTLADRPFKSQPFTLSATASSGLTVSFSTLTSAVCTVAASTVTVLAVGPCTIRASQAGNSSYAAAPNVDRSFNVVRAAQLITFLPITLRALGNPPFEMLATSSSGLVVTFASLTPSTCRVNDQWLSFMAIGVCTVRAMQPGNGNFLAAASVEQSFPITAANQTLLFPQPPTQSTLYPFTPSATASSGLPVTFSSLTLAVCTCNGTTVTLIAAGTCTIRATQSGNANYTAVSVDRSFQVQANAGIARSETAPGPMIAYSTLLGGFGSNASASSTVFDIAVTPDGAAIVGGSVAGSYFPGLDAATFTNGGLDLLFVTRMKPDRGAVDMATVVGARSPDMTGTGSQSYIGAFDTDMVEAIAVDGAGTTYVAAYANGRTYPLTGGTYLRAGAKAIFRVDGTGIVTQLPAVIDPAVRSIRALALDAQGGIYFTGVALAGLGTTVGAAIPASSAPAGGSYLIKLAPAGTSVVYATYLSVGGSRSSIAPGAGQASVDSLTTGYALAVDASGSAYVAGQAKAGDFPVTAGSPDSQDNQNRDAFVAKVNPAGSALTWVARLGGNDAERATSIALAPDGSVVIGGKTATKPFLGTNNAFQYIVPFQNLDLYCLCTESGFVAKLASDGSRWIFVAALGTYGGNLVRNFTDTSNSSVKVAVDATGAIYAAGYTSVDRQLPVGSRPPFGNLTAIQSPGFYDDGTAVATYGSSAALRGAGGFLMKMSDDGRDLLYSVIVNRGPVVALKVDAFGAAYIAGVNAGPPQIAAAQAAPGAVFVAKLLSQPAPVVLAVSPSPSVAGAVVALTATLADARYQGTVEFRDSGQLVGTASVVNGSASLSLTPPAGVHRFIATFLGGGPFNGAQSIDVVHAVNQAGTSP